MNKWIHVIYIRLKPLLVWPKHEQLCKTMPEDFKKSFPKCVCIIVCYEVFCEQPSGLMAQMSSNYKHHNTINFLIAVSPQGVISFILKDWGGRVSDKYLTENCGLFDHLLPGDQILAH